MKRFKRYLTAENLLIWGFIFTVVLPWLLTRRGWIIHFNSDTAAVGDTIGGITGPVSGLLGAVLVYLALKEQIKANKIIIDQFEHQKVEERNNKRLQYITDQIKLLRENIKEFKYTEYFEYGDVAEYIGFQGINSMLAHHSETKQHDVNIEWDNTNELQELKYYLETLLYLTQLTDRLDEEDKANLNRVISETYRTTLYPPLTKYQSKRVAWQKDCDVCGFRHGLPEYIYGIYDALNVKFNLKINQG